MGSNKIRYSAVEDIAHTTGIAESAINRWRACYGRESLKTCRPRPPGCLAIIDIVQKYNVPYGRIVKWRHAGLKFTKIGRLLVVQETELEAWLHRCRGEK